ncbi:unnamed protein product [Miscanthus lutarioriparius]|uniref:Uncharacterized protein n=1 Tax=Miscanthus lutarioriparius TaxID=422564 RepID=A0A811QEF3_9POAL|nr:unnamed protein product [Miscanthus lutarioriparius]
MASPSPASSSSYSSLETSILSEIGDLAPDDIFLCTRAQAVVRSSSTYQLLHLGFEGNLPRGPRRVSILAVVLDGRVLTVAGVGTVSCDNFRIPNARCVPDLCTGLNLVSVQQLAECGYLAMFGGGQCSVMEQSSSKIVGKGRLHADGGLYHLEFLNIPHDKACEDSSPT